jgi:putative transposase
LCLFHAITQLAYILLTFLVDVLRYLGLYFRSPAAIAAENLFLRKQLALYQECHVHPKRVTPATRLTLVWLDRWFDWRRALILVQPQTLTRWHRQGFRLFWRWKFRYGRPPIPADLRVLIRRITRENPLWGEERIANELLLKLGLRVSPRTVRKYLTRRLDRGGSHRTSSRRWQTFGRNHANIIVACDFCTVVTATFRSLYVFVIMEHATRRILHLNVTAHPDAIFSWDLDRRVRHLGLRVLKTLVRSPQANALCERLLGALRGECLDFLISLTEHHLRSLLREWGHHYNGGCPHMALGPGIPQPPPSVSVPPQAYRHCMPEHLRVVARLILLGCIMNMALRKRLPDDATRVFADDTGPRRRWVLRSPESLPCGVGLPPGHRTVGRA